MNETMHLEQKLKKKIMLEVKYCEWLISKEFNLKGSKNHISPFKWKENSPLGPKISFDDKKIYLRDLKHFQ